MENAIRLFAAGVLLLVLIALGCQHQAIAAPPADDVATRRSAAEQPCHASSGVTIDPRQIHLAPRISAA